MKKRLLTLVLALVMVLSLLPFGALAAPRSNGRAAFAHLKSYATENGKYASGSYVYQCEDNKIEDMPGTFYLKFSPADGAVTLSSLYTKSGLFFSTELVISPDLEMPFAAKELITGLFFSRMAANVDSTFSTATELVLTEESSDFQVDGMEEMFRYCLAVLLTDAQDCFAGTRFSVGDLGFTALADQAGYAYDVPAPPPEITNHPKNVTAPAGDTATFSVRAVGEQLTYRWQFRAPGTSTWYNSGMTGAKTATLSVPATAARNGQQYRCVVTNGGGSVISDAAALRVLTLPVITKQPETVAAAYGDTAKFSVRATGSGLTYQWQYKSPGSSKWKDSGMSTAKSATLWVVSEKARNGQQYRCVVTNEAGSVTSEPATLVTAQTVQPAIRTQPKAVTASPGGTATFTVKAAGGNLRYQWQFKAPGTSTWYNSGMTGAKTATLSVPATTARNGQQYRCVVTNDQGKVISNAAALTVK